MTDWWRRSGSNSALALALMAACSTSESEDSTSCTPNQFRACDADCGTGRGVQQCVEVGEDTGRWAWSDCACVVLDGGFVQADDGGAAGVAGASSEPDGPAGGSSGDPGGGAGDGGDAG